MSEVVGKLSPVIDLERKKMAIIKRNLGNNSRIIAQKFREAGRGDGLGGLAFSMFCEGWKSAWEECITQSPKLKNERIAELEAQLEEEFSRGVKEGLSQATDIVKNC